MAATVHQLPKVANSNESVKSVKEGTLHQAGAAAYVQTYSLSMLAQPEIKLVDFPELMDYQRRANDGLAKAKTHAKKYLKDILPTMIITIADFDSYFHLQNALPLAITPGMEASRAIQLLHTVQGQVQGYKTRADNVAEDLATLSTEIAGDQQAFATVVTEMNTKIKGKEGILDATARELQGLDTRSRVSPLPSRWVG